jgi:glyoxylase-like metal-dependent hydrolase (beta-lactamase superfamily II)
MAARTSADAPHTWAGFSTGVWEGEMLTVFTTHFKVGWIQRNGVAHSDQATMTEHFMRHGDVLTVVTIVDDPIYLEEPFIRSTNWVLNPTQELSRSQIDVVDEIAGQPKGYVPHYLPGSSGAQLKLSEFASKHRLPPEAARGGAETTYPEYQMTLQRLMSSPGAGSRPPPAVVTPRAPVRKVETREPEPIHLVPVQGNVYMLVGAGANMTVQIGDEGVLLVDAGTRGTSEQVLAAIRRVTDKPVRLIIDTHYDPDHIGGNEAIAKTGKWLGGNAPGNSGLTLSGARVIAHERVLARMSAPTGRQAPLPFAAWPTETFFGADKEIFFNNEAIQLLHQPAAHSDGDVVVFFRRSDVIVAGDIFDTTRFPVIDVARGGSLQGTINALNRIVELAIPKDKEEGGTYVIPGHGRLTDEADLVEYRDMVTIVRDRIQDLIRKGMTLAQVKAAGPTMDYDGRYGSPDAFIEAVHGITLVRPAALATQAAVHFYVASGFSPRQSARQPPRDISRVPYMHLAPRPARADLPPLGASATKRRASGGRRARGRSGAM